MVQAALDAQVFTDGEPLTEDRIRAMLRALPADKLAELDDQLGLGQAETFREFIARTDPGFKFYRWLEPLIDALQQVADGTLTRIIVQAPPRHGKSQVVSRLFPAYYLSRFPYRRIGLGCFGAVLANKLSRAARAFYTKSGGRLSRESSSVANWDTTSGGGMWAVGLAGGAVGDGCHLAIIDDPVKSPKHIASPTSRRALMEWYQGVFYQRLEPGAALIVMATRWHQEDLTGQLLAREVPKVEDDAVDETDESDAAVAAAMTPDDYVAPIAGREDADSDDDEGTPEGWTIFDFPALAEAPEMRPTYPASCTIVPDWRAPGEALCPERYPRHQLLRKKRGVGPSSWASNFQQRPRPRDGKLFKWDDWKIVTASHAECYRVRFWDTAGTEGEGDATAGVLLAFNPTAPIPVVIEDVIEFQYGVGRRNAQILKVAKADREQYGDVEIWIETEVGVQGTDRTRALMTMLHGFNVNTISASGSKWNRAEPLAGQQQIGNVGLIDASWNNDFREQAASFTGLEGGVDDSVDAACAAYNRASEAAGREWTTSKVRIV
jgi:phage terminase large subunit-like protein